MLSVQVVAVSIQSNAIASYTHNLGPPSPEDPDNSSNDNDDDDDDDSIMHTV